MAVHLQVQDRDAAAWRALLRADGTLAAIVCDAATQVILDASAAALALLGAVPGDVVGACLSELFVAVPAPPDRCAPQSDLRRVAMPGGQALHVALQRATLPARGGGAELYVLQDVSRHVGAVAVLRATQHELHRAQALALIGNWTWDLAADAWLTSTPEGYRLLGVRPDEIPVASADLLARIHPDDRARVQGERERALRDADYPYDVEFRLLHPDGDVRWLHSIAEVRLGADGTPLRMVGLIQDITARRRAEDSVRRLAYYDTVTGLPNLNQFERACDERLEQLRRGAGRGRAPARLACLIVDLVRFRDVNYALNHVFGDVLLALVAERLAALVGQAGVVARAEARFPIVLDGVDEEEARRWARAIHRALEAPFAVAGIACEVGARIGIALAPQQGLDYHALLRKADIALYQADHAGRNMAVYAAAADPHTPDRLALIGDFRAAIDAGHIRLYCQPKVDMARGEIVGAEALVRWCHPDKGCLAPDAFLPLIEQSDLIHLLTRHMLAGAVAQCEAWRAQGVRLPLAVNLSARDIGALPLAEHLRDLLERHGACADMIGLEMTESSLMQDPAAGIAELERLSAMGFRLYVDDFGTGHSSLSYLTQLPVDVIKIDHGFTMRMIDDRRAAAIVKSTVHLAHDLGMGVVAEGVCDARIWDALSALGCDEAQGFHIAAPMPADALLDWARASPYRLPRDAVCV